MKKKQRNPRSRYKYEEAGTAMAHIPYKMAWPHGKIIVRSLKLQINLKRKKEENFCKFKLLQRKRRNFPKL